MSKRFLILAALLLAFVVLTPKQPHPAAAEVSTAAFANAETGQILVQYKDRKDPVLYHYDSNEAAANALAGFRQRDDVDFAQPNYLYQAAALPDDPLLTDQTHLDVINAPAAWQIDSKASDVVIAIIDTGVDITHPDLKNNIWQNPKERANGVDDDNNGFVDDVHGWDFLTDSPDPTPKFDSTTSENAIGVQHGTMVAGIIAAQGDNGIGIAGIDWSAQLMPLRVLNQYGTGTSETVTKALRYAIDHKVDVINLSLVGTDYDQAMVDLLHEAYQQGIIVVAAAGNSNANLNAAKTYPVCYNNDGPGTIIGVGAIDVDYSRPNFSNYGSDCVDIVAPGVHIFSTRLTRPTFASQDQYEALFSGTSFSAPQVTGVIGLMKELNPNLHADDVLADLQKGATNISQLFTAASGFTYSLNAAGSLGLVTPAEKSTADQAASAPRFIAYPLGTYDGNGYIYQLPGPIPEAPLLFDGHSYPDGIGMFPENLSTAFIYGIGSKHLDELDLRTLQLTPLFQLPAGEENTIGSLAYGNVDFDPAPDIVVGSAAGSKPLVSIYDEHGNLKYHFAPYADDINQGLSVALIDSDGDHVHEIAVVPKAQTDADIKIFEYTGLMHTEWNAYEHFGGGATLSVADVNRDGVDDLLVGPGATGGPDVKVFEEDGTLLQEFFAGDVVDGGGADVQFLDFDGNGSKEFVVSYKQTHTPVIRIYSPEGTFQQEIGVLDGTYRGGVGIYPL